MKNYLKGALALTLLAATSGCASLITGGDLIREGVPTGTLRFVNNSQGEMFDTFLISTCDASSYGLDRLPPNVSVGPGQSFEWTVSAGCYDLMGGRVGFGSTPGERLDVRAGRVTIIQYTGDGNSTERMQ